MANWSKEKIDNWVKRLTNAELFSETFGLAGGDDCDGCFTSQGAYRFEVLQKELTKRLDSWLKS